MGGSGRVFLPQLKIKSDRRKRVTAHRQVRELEVPMTAISWPFYRR